MGVNSRLRDIRPPLPAPTETDDGGTSGVDTDAATSVTTRTEKSTYELPADGSPITIPTQKIASKKEGTFRGHQRDKSQTSLLIEYFEGSVKVSSGSKKRSASNTNDAIQIRRIGNDRKASHTRPISFGSSKYAEVGVVPTEATTRDSWASSKPPIGTGVLGHNDSDVSTRSRGLIYAPVESNVSSMPADSMIEGSDIREPERSRSFDDGDDGTVKESYLQEPTKERNRSRSKERIAQKVMEKLEQRGAIPIQSGKSRSARSLGKEYDQEGYSRGSDVSNNPKLLGMVEDTIKRIILPEIQAVKEEQRNGRNPRSAENSRRGSLLDDGLVRRVSKSSSTPNITNKPKVVLNREGDDPGTVLSRGDSERKMRKSSRGSYSEEKPKSKKSNHSLRDAGAASLGAGILTATALRQHDSQNDVQERRKRRSKSRGSRSRSTGATETGEYLSREEVPPMPMASNINDSDITRESIVSIGTEQATSEVRTPVREVSRGSLGGALASPISTRTPTRTPVSRGLGMSHGNISIDSPKSSGDGMSMKNRREIYSRHVDADGYGDSPTSQRKISSPVQSVSSLKKNFEDEVLVPNELRPNSAASRSSAGPPREKRVSQTSLGSGNSSPLARSTDGPRNSRDVYDTREDIDSPGTPNQGEDVEDWYERQHRLNDQYRKSLDADSTNRDFAPATNRDSYQTNPYPQDEKRWTMFSEDSQVDPGMSPPGEQGLRPLGANPELVSTPYGMESAVASLMDQSTISSGSPTKTSYSARMGAHLREMSKDAPPMYQGSTLSQTMPSQDRWNALKTHARDVSGSSSQYNVGRDESPGHSPIKIVDRSIDNKAALGASSLPIADDRLPEIEHMNDSESDVTTNPSIIKGPLSGDETGKDTWPYTPEPVAAAPRNLSVRDSRSMGSSVSKDDGTMAAATAGAAAMGAGYAAHKATVQREPMERDVTPDLGRRPRGVTPTSPAAFRDEGYVTDAHARSAGSLTPEAEQQRYSRNDMAEFHRAMDAHDVDEEDTLPGDIKHARHISGNSHGMTSPSFYDSSTGTGINRIESKDIVALMDHLTVRDAQRNARDTEILVSLVRSTTEMRQSFDEMRRFIVEQDRMIMQNADRTAESTAQRVLSGPRPITSKSSDNSRLQSEDDIQKKRKNVLRRALEGLKGSKSENDLTKMENMLVEILQNVEGLKHQGSRQAPPSSYSNVGLNDYERLRNAPDSGYEPDGRADTSSTPSQSGYFSPTPRAEKQQFHSGYDGRRGSANRVSTVLEGDEDELEYYVNRGYPDHFENTERLLTPTQEAYGRRGLSPAATPPQTAPTFNGVQGNVTPKSHEKQRKHQSNNSSIFGVPKVSRWSKTTASSAAADPGGVDSPNMALRNQKTLSEASRSGSTLARYQDEDYELRDDDRLRSTQSLAREQDNVSETKSRRSQASKISRTPSPLIPSEASLRSEDDNDHAREASPIQEDLDSEFDDPKYQAVRNSLMLQHPQPRPGTTPRHKNTLESQAHQFDDGSRTGSDLSQRTVSDYDPAMWGSSGTAALARSRLSQLEPLSPVSMNSPGNYGGSRISKKDAAPLVPPAMPTVPPQTTHEEPEPEFDYEPQYSNSGFSRGGYYSSPFGSGHLLEPIEEVRYSLETDSGHLSPEPEIVSAKAVDVRDTKRRITGPRPMEKYRTTTEDQPRIVETTGAVRRKPVWSGVVR